MADASTRAYLVRRISHKETYEDLLSFPRFFEIETVNACNARCPMCTIDDWDRRDGLMSDELFARITEEIGEHAGEVKRVHLYRDGEPLLDKKLPQRVKMMKEAGVKEVGISTNCALLDKAKTHALIQSGLDSIILSVDSLKKDVYEKIRLRLNFEEVMENVHYFLSVSRGTKARIRMIRQELNYDEWENFRRYWGDYVQLQDTVDYKLLHNWGGQLRGHESDFGDPTNPCVALWSLMCIFADGRVPMCNVDYNNQRPLGDINIQSIESLWRSSVQHSRRALHLEGQRAKLGLCKNCNAWEEHDSVDKPQELVA